MKKKDLISIIIPCFNEEESIKLFYDAINKISKEMKDVDYEFIFIDDGSKDNTLNIFKELNKEDKRVKYISFSRNFGKESAMLAGLKEAKGDYAAIMDVDLQDPPEKLKEMYQIIKEDDYDCVALYTKEHKDYGFIRRILTKVWYKLINKISGTNSISGERDFRLITRQIIDSIIEMPEYNRYTKGMFSFVGFKTKWIEYVTPNRVAGQSKFSLGKLMKYSLEGIVAYSTKLLLLSAFVGLFFCLIAFIVLMIIVIKTLMWGDPVSGWPSLACLVVFLGGIQLFFLGIIGIYLSKIYLEVKGRPQYIIRERNKE